MADDYLKKDRRGWYVRKRVPKDIQHILGRKEIKRTLKTRDESVAEERRHAVLAEIFREFDEARNPKPTGTLEELRDAVKSIRQDPSGLFGITPLDAFTLERDKFIRQHYGNPDSPRVLSKVSEVDQKALSQMHHLILEPEAEPLGELIHVYLEEKRSTITNQTYNTKKRRLKDLLNWLGPDVMVHTVTKRQLGQYVTSRLASMKDRYGRELSPKTKQDTVSDLRAFFLWCEGRGYIDTNPCSSLMKTLGTIVKGKPSSVRAWNKGELVQILSDANLRKDDVMMGLILIGMYSGMRGNEIAELRLEDVTDDYMRVVDGKNDNSIRKVPIHHKIAPLVRHLKATSKDEYLLEGLKRGGEDRKRYHNIGKKFNRRKSKLGFGRDTVFHSLRHSLATALENSGVHRELAEMVAGHSDQNRGITYSLYSDGLDHDVLAETLNKANFGIDVESVVQEIITEICAR